MTDCIAGINVHLENQTLSLYDQWIQESSLQCGGQGVMQMTGATSPMGGGHRVVVSTAAFHARVRGSVPGPRVKVSIVGSLCDREVACSASDRQGPNFESCVWRTVSSQSSHHPQEILLAQFSLYVHKGGLKPDSFHLPVLYMHDTLIFMYLGCSPPERLVEGYNR